DSSRRQRACTRRATLRPRPAWAVGIRGRARGASQAERSRRGGNGAPPSGGGEAARRRFVSFGYLLIVRHSVSFADEAKDGPGAQWRRCVDREAAAIGDEASAGADLLCGFGIPSAHGVERRRAGGNVDAIRIYENADHFGCWVA